MSISILFFIPHAEKEIAMTVRGCLPASYREAAVLCVCSFYFTATTHLIYIAFITMDFRAEKESQSLPSTTIIL